MRSTITAYRESSTSRAPPRTASSARTPTGTPFAFTTSKNGPGNVFSRPTSRPTTRSDIPTHHLLPVRPVVGPSRPHVQPHVDALGPQQLAAADGVGHVRVLLSRGDDLLLHRAQRPEVRLVVQSGQERHRVGE